MSSADFCATIGESHNPPSPVSGTQRRPPGVSSAAFGAQPPDLRFASLTGMDFAVSCRLVRRGRLLIRFLSIGSQSAHPIFLQTPPHDDALALLSPFPSVRVGRGLSPPDFRTCPAHNIDPSLRSGRHAREQIAVDACRIDPSSIASSFALRASKDKSRSPRAFATPKRPCSLRPRRRNDIYEMASSRSAVFLHPIGDRPTPFGVPELVFYHRVHLIGELGPPVSGQVLPERLWWPWGDCLLLWGFLSGKGPCHNNQEVQEPECCNDHE